MRRPGTKAMDPPVGTTGRSPYAAAETPDTSGRTAATKGWMTRKPSEPLPLGSSGAGSRRRIRRYTAHSRCRPWTWIQRTGRPLRRQPRFGDLRSCQCPDRRALDSVSNWSTTPKESFETHRSKIAPSCRKPYLAESGTRVGFLLL